MSLLCSFNPSTKLSEPLLELVHLKSKLKELMMRMIIRVETLDGSQTEKKKIRRRRKLKRRYAEWNENKRKLMDMSFLDVVHGNGIVNLRDGIGFVFQLASLFSFLLVAAASESTFRHEWLVTRNAPLLELGAFSCFYSSETELVFSGRFLPRCCFIRLLQSCVV